MKLLEDIIGGNKRRQAYADSILAQAEVNLADHEVKKARREGKASEREVSKLMQKLEDKRKAFQEETEDLEKLAQREAKKDAKTDLKVTKGGKSA
jgi:predicted  nucleic acid-binding Zn-ribbon protein